MLDDLIDIGCAFDWITPTFAFLRDFTAGPVAHFGISAYSGYDRGDIRRLLQSHGVKVWGLIYNFDGDMLMFTVPNTHARWAYYILVREGVPILYAPKEAIPKDGTVFKHLDRLDEMPQTTLTNNTRMADMTIIPAPSIWGWLGRLF